MSYSPYAHTTATTARLGLIKLGTGVSADTNGTLITTSVPSITSGQVTTALGFTPYNATNPNSYITGITSSMVTTALGYTPYNSSNPSNFISAVPNASTQVSSLGVGTAASGTSGEIRATNNITGYYTSDRSLKENIRNIESALSKVKSINGVMFDWKQDYIDSRGGEDGYFVRKQDTGVIAQEVESILPEVVGTREDGTKAVAYEKMTGLLIEAIKELDIKIEDIKRHLGI